MSDDDLARRVRDYAHDRAGKRLFEDGGFWVSSAWLALHFDVDPRTIAAALRPYGVRPGPVEPGVRGYGIPELAAIRFDDDVPDVASRITVNARPGGTTVVYEPDAVERLSAGAGHDMTPALRAAGLL